MAALASAYPVLEAGPVAAQADDKAAAEALFDRGIKLMREGKTEQACKALERSQAIERGIGTMLYLADCYEKLGRVASAWALFREAASAAAAQGQQERAASGTERADRLEPKLSKLTIEVAEENDIGGFELLRNGVLVRKPSWGVQVPVDPGEHNLAARAPGRQPWSQTVTIRPGGEAIRVVVPPLTVDPNAVAAEKVEQPLEPSEPVQPVEPAPPVDQGMHWQRTAGLVVGGVGVVALGVGTVFGINALGKASDVEGELNMDDQCPNQACIDLNEEAKDDATLSTAFVISGAALAIGGAVLYLTAPSEESPQLALRAAPAGARLTLGGVF